VTVSYRIPKLGDDGKVAPEHIPDPAAIGAATSAQGTKATPPRSPPT
jgi:hypothetical protein